MADTRAALACAASRLGAAGVEKPGREARLLLAHAQGRGGGIPDMQAVVPHAFHVLLERRCTGEPLALIVGHKGFWTLDLAVSGATLVPRADSETLIEAALAAFPERGTVRRILDLGTGTGALLLAALQEFSCAFGLGVDRRPDACRLARSNARAAGLDTRASLVCGDWAHGVAGPFDLVLANPPYIRSGDIAGLESGVRDFEPASALDGGPDGLDAYRVILPQLPRLLTQAGMAILEVGEGQAGAVETLADAAALVPSGRRADLSGIDRAVLLRPTAKKPFGTSPSGDYVRSAR